MINRELKVQLEGKEEEITFQDCDDKVENGTQILLLEYEGDFTSFGHPDEIEEGVSCSFEGKAQIDGKVDDISGSGSLSFYKTDYGVIIYKLEIDELN